MYQERSARRGTWGRGICGSTSAWQKEGLPGGGCAETAARAGLFMDQVWDRPMPGGSAGLEVRR